MDDSEHSDDKVIKYAIDIVRRRLKRPNDILSEPSTVKNYLILNLAEKPYEVFGGVFLDVRNNLIGIRELFRGSVAHTSIYPREVVREAMWLNASSVILYHNHPAGSAEPTYQDRETTTMLSNALKLIDVRVVDHIIIAGTEVVSFCELGLL